MNQREAAVVSGFPSPTTRIAWKGIAYGAHTARSDPPEGELTSGRVDVEAGKTRGQFSGRSQRYPARHWTGSG